MNVFIALKGSHFLFLRLFLYMCKAEKPHLGDRIETRGYEFNEQLQTYYKS